jgi:hypothetical protein
MGTKRKPATPAAPVGGGIGSGTVRDSDRPPSGHYWDRLEAAKGNVDDLADLLEELEQHGFSRDGQIMQAAQAAYQDVGGRSVRLRSRKTKSSQQE